MPNGRNSSLSLETSTPREQSVPYKLPDNETKLQLKEVSIYVAWIPRRVDKLLLRTFRNRFHHVLDNSKRAKEVY